jgi:hypothetical protein
MRGPITVHNPTDNVSAWYGAEVTTVTANVRVVAMHKVVAAGITMRHALQQKRRWRFGVAQHNHVAAPDRQPADDEQTVTRPKGRLHAGIGNNERGQRNARRQPREREDSARERNSRLANRVDELAADLTLIAWLAFGLYALGVPEDLGDLPRGGQQLLGGVHVDLLFDGRGQLGGLPHDVVQVGVLLEMLGLEVVRPQNDDLVLGEFGVLFLDSRVTRDLHHVGVPLILAGVLSRGLETLDELDHADDGQCSDLRRVWVVDTARDVTVRMGDTWRSHAVERLEGAIHQRVHSPSLHAAFDQREPRAERAAWVE